MRILKYSLLIVLLAVAASHATINVTWNWDESAAAGMYLSDSVTLLPVGSIVQILFTADAVLGGVDLANPLLAPAGDILIAQANTTDAGYYLNGPANYGIVGDYVGGYVYQRIFTSDISPTTGEYAIGLHLYGASPANTATAEGSTVFCFAWDSNLEAQPTFTAVIPEPSTIMLSILGLGMIMVRRFRK
ncbi:MAG: PEP-CTERM sorting domain-containing protein [Kiritimatiellia bacterium]